MNNVKSWPAKVWVLSILIALSCFLMFARVSGIWHASAVFFAAALIGLCVDTVRLDKDGIPTAAMLDFLGKPWRSVGSGLILVFRPFGIPVERIAKTISLKKVMVSKENSTINAETADEESIKLDYAVWYRVTVAGLIKALSFGEELTQAINERIRSLISTDIRTHIVKEKGSKKTLRDIVHDTKDEIAKRISDLFNGRCPKKPGSQRKDCYANEFGVELTFAIDDPETPADLVNAKLKVEVQEKENQRRALEMRKLKTMANQLVAAAEKRGQKLNFEQAMEAIQIQLGIVKKTNATFGLNPGTMEVIKDILPVILPPKPPAPVEPGSAYSTPRKGFDGGTK